MDTQTAAFELGRKHADLFLGFACFLQEQARREELDTLFFCTREGVFFKAVYDSLFGATAEGEFHQRTGLLEVSRLSAFAPSLLKGNSIDFGQLFKLYSQQTPVSILQSLGQNSADFNDLLEQHGLEPDEIFESPASALRLKRFLSDPGFSGRICPGLAEQREALCRYLQQHFSDQAKIGFVEIGWRGTIQNSIARLCPGRFFHGMYLGLALERNEMAGNCDKIAYGPDRNRSAADADLLDAINVLEFVCLSNAGSAERYDTGTAGTITARMQHVLEEDACIEEFSLPFQRGVQSVADEAEPGALFREHVSGQLKIKAMDQWRSLLRKPSPALVKTYFSLKSNEQFGRGAISDQSLLPSFATVILAPFSGFRRQRLVRYLTYSQWAEGMLQRRDLGILQRWMFYRLMKLALRYKHRAHSAGESV